jgi:Domain of unknown function (DUF4382)
METVHNQLPSKQSTIMTTKMKNLYVAVSCFFSLLLVFTACQKAETSKTSNGETLGIYLTDGPGKFDKVLLQINAVEVKLDTSASHMDDDDFGDRNGSRDDDDDDHQRGKDEFGQWDTLKITAGTYDLLTLRNGVDALIASGTISGRIRKIRLTVGSVTVEKDGVSYPVNLFPGANNYLYVRIHDEHIHRSGDDAKLWVDFDVARSIIEINGQYFLRPVLRPFCDDNFAEVEGVVLPAEAGAIVRVYNASDTASAFPEKDGKYKVRGLTEGTYSITFLGIQWL